MLIFTLLSSALSQPEGMCLLILPVFFFFLFGYISVKRFGFVNFKSVDDQEKALELSELEVLGYKIKLKKPKGKETKKGMQTRYLVHRYLCI